MKKLSITVLILLLIVVAGYFFWKSGKLDQLIKSPLAPVNTLEKEEISEEIIQKNQTLPYEERKLKTGDELGLTPIFEGEITDPLQPGEKNSDGDGNLYSDPGHYFNAMNDTTFDTLNK